MGLEEGNLMAKKCREGGARSSRRDGVVEHEAGFQPLVLFDDGYPGRWPGLV